MIKADGSGSFTGVLDIFTSLLVSETAPSPAVFLVCIST